MQNSKKFECDGETDSKNISTAATGFDKTEAYQKMQNDVMGVLKQRGPPYM